MPTQEVPLTSAAPIDIKAALSLIEGTTYSIQARGGNVLLTEQFSTPTIGTTPTHLLANDGATGAYTVRAGEVLYAWAQYKPCLLVITEDA